MLPVAWGAAQGGARPIDFPRPITQRDAVAARVEAVEAAVAETARAPAPAATGLFVRAALGPRRDPVAGEQHLPRHLGVPSLVVVEGRYAEVARQMLLTGDW